MTMPNRELVEKFKQIFFESGSADESMDAMVQASAEIIMEAPEEQIFMWLLAIMYGGARAVQTIMHISDERLERAVSLINEDARHDVLKRMGIETERPN